MNKPDKQYTDLLQDIESQILMVKQDILNRFPDCRYTIRINLWDDDTSSVECRHGDGEKIYSSTFYNNELVYKEITQTGEVMVIDEKGIEHLKFLRDE
jgi:hypothetical protein